MKLDRIAYLPEATVGRLMIDGCETLYTIERPWIAGRAPGGAPNVSCVPDGVYSLVRHARPNGDVCVALRNPSCGVYYSQEHVPAAGGRTLILIHSANYASELQGCIAPGRAAGRGRGPGQSFARPAILGPPGPLAGGSDVGFQA